MSDTLAKIVKLRKEIADHQAHIELAKGMGYPYRANEIVMREKRDQLIDLLAEHASSTGSEPK